MQVPCNTTSRDPGINNKLEKFVLNIRNNQRKEKINV